MCLTKKDFKGFKVAKKDIIVYKVAVKKDILIKNDNGNIERVTAFSSFYRNSEVKLNTVLIEDFSKMKPDYDDLWKKYSFEIGFHSFINKRTPIRRYKDNLKYRNSTNGTTVLLFKCIIPKGSHYIDGYFYGSKSMISDKIIYLKPVKIKSFLFGF